MKPQTQNRLIIISIIVMVVTLGLYLFITKGDSGLHENLRMNRAALMLEQDEMIIHTYGTNCSIRRMESGLQAAAVLHMEHHHVSRFELTAPSGIRYINVKWSCGGRGLGVAVQSFTESP